MYISYVRSHIISQEEAITIHFEHMKFHSKILKLILIYQQIKSKSETI